MKALQILRASMVATGLLACLSSRAANSTVTPSPDLSTTQGHLDAAQTALDLAYIQIHEATTTNRGGFVDAARSDLDKVNNDLKEARAYVAAHPETNKLSPGPAQAKAPNLPQDISQHEGHYPNLNDAIDDLNTALHALGNNPTGNSHGPVLGDIGGIRARIITDILKTGADIFAAADYADTHPPGKPSTTAAKTPAPPAKKTLTPEQLKALVLIEGDYSRGTGFVAKIHDQFFIVTNLHVLSGNSKFTVTGMDGTKYPTTGPLYGATDRDVAILKIPPELAPNYLEFQDDALAGARAGDPVVVPGNSYGAGVPLEIAGKVLGVGPKFAEVDAKFVEGNSGSPVFHLASGKVIGIATFAIIYNVSDLGKAAKAQNVRWFGVRLDNIDAKDWEALDWKRFSEAGIKIRGLEEVSRVMLALLQNQKLPSVKDEQVLAFINKLQTSVALAEKNQSDRDMLNAVQTFMQNLQDWSKHDIRALTNDKLYTYHADILKKQQDLLAQVDKAFAAASKQITAFKNSL